MSEGPVIQIIPVFPLSIVQFPGAVTPLHIFEERYRRMLREVMAGEKVFGITWLGEDDASGEPPVGKVGCTVEVIAEQEMPDGRSNILCSGGLRYRTLRHLYDEQYLQAEVECFEDEPEGEELRPLADRAAKLFQRVIAAGKKLKDASVVEEHDIPELPENPESLSFLIAASLDLANEEKQELLELTLTSLRLRRLNELLSKLAVDYERRARTHQISKRNGHGGPVRF
jgi:Lon protease-like protein